MKNIFRWICKEIPEDLRPAKGILAGCVIGLILWIIFLLLLWFCPSCSYANQWTQTDTSREVIWLGLHIIDWGQTLDAARNPQQYKEINPVIGTHPSVGKVNIYMGAWVTAHPVISYILPPKWRLYWQWIGIIVKTGCVINNNAIGLQVRF